MGRPIQVLIAVAWYLSLASIAQTQERPRIVPLEAVAGTWSGSYGYSDNRKPVAFTLTISVAGNSCTGRIEEPNTFGHPSAPKLYANMVCRVDAGSTGPTLVFRKTYDGTGGQSHSVDYAGQISRDSRTVKGTWNIGAATGRFSMSKQ